MRLYTSHRQHRSYPKTDQLQFRIRAPKQTPGYTIRSPSLSNNANTKCSGTNPYFSRISLQAFPKLGRKPTGNGLAELGCRTRLSPSSSVIVVCGISILPQLWPLLVTIRHHGASIARCLGWATPQHGLHFRATRRLLDHNPASVEYLIRRGDRQSFCTNGGGLHKACLACCARLNLELGFLPSPPLLDYFGRTCLGDKRAGDGVACGPGDAVPLVRDERAADGSRQTGRVARRSPRPTDMSYAPLTTALSSLCPDVSIVFVESSTGPVLRTWQRMARTLSEGFSA